MKTLLPIDDILPRVRQLVVENPVLLIQAAAGAGTGSWLRQARQRRAALPGRRGRVVLLS